MRQGNIQTTAEILIKQYVFQEYDSFSFQFHYKIDSFHFLLRVVGMTNDKCKLSHKATETAKLTESCMR